ncbi:Wzz/FepE/Etk N-terminal domain-containing protein [Actinocatenispora sera]|uniref:Wzz/FepE/Etk N-terminal domain-containing protein n=1 Tax=Actinocatenispora sera TaxID=390989 RepID=UPI0033ED8068
MSDRLGTRDIPRGDADSAAAPTMTLTQLLAVPRRRWRWVLACALLGVVAVAGYLTLLPARYTATAVVTVRAVVTDPFSYPGPGADRAVNMNVETGIATGSRVADAVAKATGGGRAAVDDALTVEVPVGGQVLRFEYVADSSADAIRGSNAAARAYLQVRRDDYRDQQQRRLAAYDATLKKLNGKLDAAEKAARRDGDLGQNGSTGNDTTRALNDQISTVTERRADVAAIDLTPGTLTSPAAAPVPSNHDRPLLFGLAGLLGGALLGAAVSFVRESTDRRVRGAADVPIATAAPLLGVVRRGNRTPARARHADVDHVALAVARLGADGRPVMLLSARDDEGRADLSADVAVALAGFGRDVFLGDVVGTGTELCARVRGASTGRPRDSVRVDPSADANTPTPERIAAQRATAGQRTGTDHATAEAAADLTDTVQLPAMRLAEGGIERAAVRVPVNGTPRRIVSIRPDSDDALTARPIPVVPVGKGTVAVGPAGAAPDDAGLVLLDAPPLDDDARGVRMLADAAAVLVAVPHRTRLAELRRAADRLAAAGCPVSGVVLVRGRP